MKPKKKFLLATAFTQKKLSSIISIRTKDKKFAKKCKQKRKASGTVVIAERWRSDRTAISVEVRVPAAATKPGSFLVRGEEKASQH